MSPVSSAASPSGGTKGTGSFSKKKTSLSLDCLFNRLLQSSQPCHHVRAEVHTDRATVALAEAEEVAERLGRFEHAERVRPAWARARWAFNASASVAAPLSAWRLAASPYTLMPSAVRIGSSSGKRPAFLYSSRKFFV